LDGVLVLLTHRARDVRTGPGGLEHPAD
jgi:hypothetical protein